MSSSPDPISSVTKALASHLKANMPSLSAAYVEWPSPNEKLVYPSLSIFAKAPEFITCQHHIVSKDSLPSPQTDPPTFVTRVRKVTGSFSFSMQIDLWADYKPQRNQLMAEFLAAMTTDSDVPGVRLQLSNYYDEWASFVVTSLEPINGEEGAQRNEWRAIATVVADCRVIHEYVATLIGEIENTLETPNSIPAPEAEESGPII